MKNKGRSILKLLSIFVVLGLVSFVATYGIGENKSGSARDIKLGLDLAGGVSITYETVKENPSQEEMRDTIYKLRKRVDNVSTEADVYQEGKDRINVDIPGVKDANKILKEMGKAGAIQFVDEAGQVVLEGSDIQTAEAQAYQGNIGTEYVVSLNLNSEGASKFAKATAENIGKRILIVYDGEVISDPVVQSAITGGKAQIDGQRSFEEASNLATTIRIGALPLELSEFRSNVVGAKLGEEAINTSVLAGVIGFVLVAIFMIAFYKIPGIAATIALALYAVLMIVLINVFGVTLTLPGIAGIILSIGMAVDADCIIFARIREEIAAGKTIRSSIKIGFSKALSAIIDGNITTLIAAAVLWLLGTGTIKGFAQTLAIGILLSMFTALVITRFTLNTLYDLGLDKEYLYGTQKEVKVIPFVQHKLKYFIISIVLILFGIGAMFYNKADMGTILDFGLDFQGGTSTEVTFPMTVDENLTNEVRNVVSNIINDSMVVEGANQLIIRTQELSLDQRNDLENTFVKDYNVDEELVASASISGAFSSEMRKDAIISVVIATICMLLYIWFRFKNISFGLASVLPLVHDVLIVLMVYTVARISVNGAFIAVMLTIVGYSINATIVTFDRIRENMGTMLRKESIDDMVNKSITQTLSRSINTSLTTFVMVLVLFALGVSSIKEFAAPLMAGIIGGTYSSVFIAGALWSIFYKKFKREND